MTDASYNEVCKKETKAVDTVCLIMMIMPDVLLNIYIFFECVIMST